jgi:hypothetical protein
MKTELKESFYQHRRTGITHQGSLRARTLSAESNFFLLLLIFALESFFRFSSLRNLKVFVFLVCRARLRAIVKARIDLRLIFACLHARLRIK